MEKTLWLRSETKENERRCALTPSNAKKLIDLGIELIVEKSAMRIFPDEEYEKIGATLVPEHSWRDGAPLENTYILGLKEIEVKDLEMKHNHIYFAHVYKGQEGYREVLNKYKNDGGTLFDLEFLMNKEDKRIAAFGYWAGYVGAAITLENYLSFHSDQKCNPLKSYTDKNSWLESIKKKLYSKPSVIIIGALGRCGTGARDLFKELGIPTTDWDFAETKQGGPFKEILEHDIFINTVLMNTKIPPFLNEEIMKSNKRLSFIGDVSCDPNSDLNPIPIYDSHTSWDAPYITSNGVNVIAIDNLPSALPLESSIDFSDQLYPYLKELLQGEKLTYTWENAQNIFETHRDQA